MHSAVCLQTEVLKKLLNEMNPVSGRAVVKHDTKCCPGGSPQTDQTQDFFRLSQMMQNPIKVEMIKRKGGVPGEKGRNIFTVPVMPESVKAKAKSGLSQAF